MNFELLTFPCREIIKLSTHKYTVRVFVKDGLSRDHDLHCRDDLPSPNHSAPQTNAFLMVFASLHNYMIGLHNHGFDSDSFY